MREEDFLKLSPKKQEQLQAFRDSQISLNDSEANLENQTRWRIIYEKAPPETIPFIIYCSEVVVMSLVGLILVISYTKTNLDKYISLIIIFCALFFPLLVLPGKSWKDVWNWFRTNILRRKD